MELKFKIKNQIMKRKDKEDVVQKSRNLVIASFLFTDEWDNLDKFAIFEDSHQRAYTVHLGKSRAETCVVPATVLKGRYFTVSVYAGNIITTNAVTVYLRKSPYGNHNHCDAHHRHYEKDIFVEIFESINSKIDDVVFSEDTIQFWGDDELIQSITLPYANETRVDEWIADIDERINTANDAIEEINTALDSKADVEHTHSKADVVDFDDEVETNIDNLLDNLTDELNN